MEGENRNHLLSQCIYYQITKSLYAEIRLGGVLSKRLSGGYSNWELD